MSALKIKKGDTVKIIAGKDKGKEGKVLLVDAKSSRVIVEGLNIVKRHSKPSTANQKGGIISKEAPIHISNVALVVNGETTKVGFEIKDGKKVRIARKTGEEIK